MVGIRSSSDLPAFISNAMRSITVESCRVVNGRVFATVFATVEQAQSAVDLFVAE
jgi:hypothetical protein